MEDRELIIRLTMNMETLTKSVGDLGIKVDGIQINHIVKTTTDMAVMQEKVTKLEKVVYGALGAVFIELIGLIFMIFKK